jgi:hypothetical protein
MTRSTLKRTVFDSGLRVHARFLFICCLPQISGCMRENASPTCTGR